MILPNLTFDIVLFGLMIVAVVFDALQPLTHGASALIVLGFIAFLAAEDAAHYTRRFGWGQESLASALTVSLFGFIYFWWRNQSDTAATALHICLMLSALMVLIGIVAAFGAAWKESSRKPLAGLVATSVAGVLLGAAGGLALLFWTSGAALGLKLAVVVAAFAVWRVIAHKTLPAVVVADALLASASKTRVAAATGETVAEEDVGAPRVLRPANGTTLNRALPLVLLGALAAFIAR